MVVCQFFLRGTCKFGNNCRNEHPKGNSSNFGGGGGSVGSFGKNDKYHFNSTQSSTFDSSNTFGSRFGSNKSNTNAAEPNSVIQLVRKELQEWDVNKVWPLSCFAALKEQKCLPGLQDSSPEELRLEAYKCKETRNLQPYLDGLAILSNQTMNRRNELKSFNNQQFLQEINAASNSQPSSGLLGSSQSSSGLFGSSQSSTGLFSSSQSKSSTNLFGSSNQKSTGLFGSSNQTTNSMFGSTSQAAPSTGLFGSTTSQSTSLFGSKPNPFTTGGNVGGFGTSNSTGLFGSGQQTSSSNTGLFSSSNNSGGLFSGNKTQGNSGGLFSNTGATNTGSFSLKPASTLPTPFGSSSNTGNPFGSSQTSASSGGLFSSQPSTGLFGSQQNSAGGMFGSNPSVSSSTNQGSGLFGTSTNSNSSGGLFSQQIKPSGLFGSASTQSSSVTPSTASVVNPFLTQTQQNKQIQQQQQFDQLKTQQVSVVTHSIIKIPTPTAEDLVKFKADKFELGKIPTCPPPVEFCR